MAADCKTILIIEDDESIRETMRLALEFEGYNIFTAANGQEGIDVLPNMPRPFLILLDLMMPVMDGWGFMDALERDRMLASIPVVIATAFSDAAKTIGVKEIIKKPVDLDVLFKVVARYCNKP